MSIVLDALKKASPPDEESARPDFRGREVFFRGSSAPTDQRKVWMILGTGVVIIAVVLWELYSSFLIPVNRTQSPVSQVSLPGRSLPPAAGTAVDKGTVLGRESRPVMTMEQGRKSSVKWPDDAEGHNHHGMALRRMGKLQEAQSEYQKALTLSGEYVEAMNNLAVVYSLEGDTQGAMNMLQKALTLRPQYAEAHLNMAVLLDKMKKPQEAKEHYEAFLRQSPADLTLVRRVHDRLKELGG
jgi:hypothetical protein